MSIAQSGSDNGLKCFETLVKARARAKERILRDILGPLGCLEAVCNTVDKPEEPRTQSKHVHSLCTPRLATHILQKLPHGSAGPGTESFDVMLLQLSRCRFRCALFQLLVFGHHWRSMQSLPVQCFCGDWASRLVNCSTASPDVCLHARKDMGDRYRLQNSGLRSSEVTMKPAAVALSFFRHRQVARFQSALNELEHCRPFCRAQIGWGF